jgi:hypothetical protein
MIKSVVKPQDFILSLNVESAYFHVPIHPKHRKFFSSHLALSLFVNNKFIELQSGGYFYLRAVISDCLLIGFIRSTETLKKNCKD